MVGTVGLTPTFIVYQSDVLSATFRSDQSRSLLVRGCLVVFGVVPIFIVRPVGIEPTYHSNRLCALPLDEGRI